MNVAQIQQLRNALASDITQLVRSFEIKTGCVVHSLPVIQNPVVTVEVKVQIP
jgi:hypothetical protein